MPKKNSVFWRSVDLTGNQTVARGLLGHGEFWRSVDLTGNQTGEHPSDKPSDKPEKKNAQA